MERGPLFKDLDEKNRLEARNAGLQSQRIRQLIPAASGLIKPPGYDLRLTSDLIKDLHYVAMREIYPCAGQFRDWSVRIVGSSHRPPEGSFIEGLVQDMCDRANEGDWDPAETAAFLLWKLNWIHPFGGGNGRTSRAVAHLALCVRLGFERGLPGNPTLAEYIDANRRRYAEALRDADRAWQESNTIDMGLMTGMIADILEAQFGSLREAHD